MNADYFFVATKLITGQALDTNRNDWFLRGFFREYNALLRLVRDVESRELFGLFLGILGVESK